jgi:hypothetical protein
MQSQIISSISNYHPFGENSCQQEIELFQEEYQRFYFDHVSFNKKAVDPRTFLIIGRRGTGKSSLIEYFSFQKELKSTCIIMSEPTIYENVLSALSEKNLESFVAINKAAELWEMSIWAIIFHKYAKTNNIIKAADIISEQDHITAYEVVKNLLSKFLNDTNGELTEKIEGFISKPVIEKAKEQVFLITAQEPLIIAIDSLEDYPVENEEMMNIIAGLIEVASNFNTKCAKKGIYLKVFLTSEIYPHLIENVIQNTSKTVRNPLFMNWRPKELLRLICYRLYCSLRCSNKKLAEKIGPINWDNYTDVIQKIWIPYFGKEMKNLNGMTENTFLYLLRHTQLRPRQMVILCNEIGKISIDKNVFPNFSNVDIPKIVKSVEVDLAVEVINSYKKIYKNVSGILDALGGLPPRFKGNQLDKVASRTAALWPSGNYNLIAFRKIVTELGIVGRVRNYDETKGIVEADFEYFMKERASLMDSDECVIHPMFYKRFNIKSNICVLPFPDHPDFKELD